MRRPFLFALCALAAVVFFAAGWMIPAFLRAVDTSILRKAGKRTPTLVQSGLELVRHDQLGAAELLLQAAREQAMPDRAELGLAVTNLASEHPGWLVWGGGDRHLEPLFAGSQAHRSDPASKDGTAGDDTNRTQSSSQPLTDWVIRLENRGKVLELMQASSRPAVRELLRCRALTNTTIFPPSSSASGQAFDAAVSICGLLLGEDKLNSALSNAVVSLAADAPRNPQPLEEVLMDFLSLGQRLNWGQLAAFVRSIQDPQTLRVLGNVLRKSEAQLPGLFATVQLSGNADGTARYLSNFSQTGLADLSGALRFGAGGVNELLGRQQRPHDSRFRDRLTQNSVLGALAGFAVDYGWQKPGAALIAKWILYLLSGFFLAMALHFARPAVPVLERPLQVRGFHVAREVLFALGFLVVVLFLSEPFLAQESQKAQFAFRLRLPSTDSPAVATTKSAVKASFMDPKSLLTLLLFFVLQALIYTACLVKLAEIRRQKVPPRMKLRLLENEEHLFDAGLYLGFAGTIISLILVSLGLIKPSLMAAYSSTSFGIIFVSIFKIFHLRPVRRVLLLESEAELPRSESAPAGRPLPAPL